MAAEKSKCLPQKERESVSAGRRLTILSGFMKFLETLKNREVE